MSQSVSILALTLRASGNVLPYRCVGFGDGQIAAQGAKVKGVSDYGAVVGELYAATVVGTAIVETGAAIAVGDALIADVQGRAIPSTGPLAVKAGATAVTSVAANGPILQGGDPSEFVFADALEAASGPGKFIEILLRR